MLQKQINYCGNTEKVTKAVKLYDWNVFSSFQVQRTAHQPPPARNTGGSPKEIILIVPRSADIWREQSEKRPPIASPPSRVKAAWN